METLTWGQFGLAGLVAMSLGTVIAYIFKLLLTSQQAALKDAQVERDTERAESRATQRTAMVTLADVARVMAEVQTMLREREIQRVMRERERGDNGG